MSEHCVTDNYHYQLINEQLKGAFEIHTSNNSVSIVRICCELKLLEPQCGFVDCH